MTTALAVNPLPTDLRTGLTLPLSRSLDWPDLQRHRAMVGTELEVMAVKMTVFGWERDRGTYARDRLITDWMDALQDYPLAEVQAACRAHVLSKPRVMPNEGDIVALIMGARRKHVDALPKPREPEPERKRPTPAEAEAILRKGGFSVRRVPQ